MDKRCLYCGMVFDAIHDTDEYCTDRCRVQTELETIKKETSIEQCKFCGKSYRKYFAEDLYCSIKCKKEDTKYKPVVKECATCHKVFIAKQPQHKYCSKECIPVKRNRFMLFSRDNFRCVYCGSSTFDSDQVHLVLDHIYPYSLGGPTTADNLVTACSECNIAKSGNRLSSEDESRLLSLVSERNEKLGIAPKTEIKISRKLHIARNN